MRTCQRLGLRTVAVYSDADARALHVAVADDSVHIGGSRAADSYLNPTRILDAARTSNARAIHPGYGFLSENADFAQAVLDAGLLWIGPPPGAMRALGDKARAKALAERAGVPLLAGYHAEDQSPSTLKAQADRIGYPVLIKASAGGGGRGMRVVHLASDFDSALEGAQREARASFGDDRVLLERYVERPRHVEVQILGDVHGALVHLGERECSIQRRYQKLIEESPSPAVDADLRQRLGQAALRLAHAAGYWNAGTVEFLVDQDGAFAFLEVNARLQVEHPVTEAITGLDLVELQLRVAAGEPLGLTQADIVFAGHAIEARVIAEDPLSGFLPSSGTLEVFRAPDSVRVDTWVHDGTTVSPYYDSLLAKVIAYDVSRVAAARRLADALCEMRIGGVRHNVDLLLATVQSPAFLAGRLDTHFIEEHRLLQELAEVPGEVLAAAVALDRLATPPVGDPWQARTSWRQARLDQPAAWTRAGRSHAVRISSVAGDLNEIRVDVNLDGDSQSAATATRNVVSHHARLGATRERVVVDGEMLNVADHGGLRVVEWQGRSYRLDRARAVRVDDVASTRQSGGESGQLTAPMPGRIVKLAVAIGDQVAQNQPLVVLEAMKMEHVVEAPHAGSVAEVHVRENDQVSAGELLVTLAPLE
ncbi:MAG: biotin/lipoyl-binding protein [Chloroflexi bacterium]|nr:biotin/lipoyl-binding protein [Chloroflexota bacterium]